ncbi:hypothetical protein [Bradyrhizobium yuanmingense]|uniref:hypothetical protein n=1 Tax=Bradyrhizobium yuanmingense TaxID=108015 RepID=UPI0004B46B6C|nr:hypothetical protein [Bradyrhizobium yuanmingense]
MSERSHMELLRELIEQQYESHPTGCGTSFSEILCWEIHTNGMTFIWLAEKWGVSLPVLGELIWDHCKRLEPLPAVNHSYKARATTQPLAAPVKREKEAGVFDAWFGGRFPDPDGRTSHLPSGFKDDLRSAWNAALALSRGDNLDLADIVCADAVAEIEQLRAQVEDASLHQKGHTLALLKIAGASSQLQLAEESTSDEVTRRHLHEIISWLSTEETDPRVRAGCSAADVIERVARENVSDPATDDLTVPLAVKLAEVEAERDKWHRVAMEAGAVTCQGGGHIYPLRDRVKQLEALVEEAKVGLQIFLGVLRGGSSHVLDCYELHVNKEQYSKAIGIYNSLGQKPPSTVGGGDQPPTNLAAFTSMSGYSYYRSYISINRIARDPDADIEITVRGAEKSGAEGPNAVIRLTSSQAARLFQEALTSLASCRSKAAEAESAQAFTLTPLMLKLLKRAWKTTGVIILSDDMAFRHAEMKAMRELAAQGLVRCGDDAKEIPGPPRPRSWFITDAGKAAIPSTVGAAS